LEVCAAAKLYSLITLPKEHAVYIRKTLVTTFQTTRCHNPETHSHEINVLL